jgi:hypothetical protein
MRVAVISRSISQNYVKTDLKAAAGLQAIRGFCFHSVVRKQEKQASKQASSVKKGIAVLQIGCFAFPSLSHSLSLSILPSSRSNKPTNQQALPKSPWCTG